MIAPLDTAAQLVVATDLDGTLLDRDTYSFEESRPAVQRLQAADVPLVFCSSKTRAEQAYYRAALAVRDPFIVENGSAVFVPDGTFDDPFPFDRRIDGVRVVELGVPVAEVRRGLAAACAALGLTCRGYADLPLAEVCRLTDLDEAAARRAMQRDYSETILDPPLTPEAVARLNARLVPHGLRCVAGSRFHTVAGAGSDKGRAVQRLTELFRHQHGAVVTIGLGDSPNDAPMLAAVDHAFLVQRPDGTWADVDVPGLQRVKGVGPTGWRFVMEALFEV